MGRPNVIDKQGIGPRVLTMGATMGSRQIAALLENEGYKVSHAAVYRYLQDHLTDHQEATEQVRAKVQEELQKEALSDVQMLESLRNKLADVVFHNPPQAIGMYGPIFQDDGSGSKVPVVDRSLWLKATKELRDTLSIRLKTAGAGEGEEKGLQVFLNVPEGVRHGGN